MASTDCEYVVRLYGMCLGTRMMLVSEFIPYGSLYNHLRLDQLNLTAKSMLTFAVQIASVSFILYFILKNFNGGILIDTGSSSI